MLLLLILLAAPTGPTRATAERSDLRSSEPAATPPNILLLIADDLGIEHLEFYGLGTEFVSTPNLAELAASGLMFTEAWANPLCSITRATIHTGRYAFRTGIGSNTFTREGVTQQGLQPEELILPELLKFYAPTAYSSALFGKWHLGSDESLGGSFAPNLAGYDHYEGVLATEELGSDGAISPDFYFDYPKTVNGVTARVTERYQTTDTIDSAINWITGAAGPWFVSVTDWSPHFPFHWPPEDLHSQDTGQEGDLPRYRAMVEALDYEIGRLLDSIDPASTLIIFTSDNGSPKEVAVSPVLPTRAKGTLFQGGIRVPLLISGVGVSAGTVDGIVNLSDLFATIAEVAGATPPIETVLDSQSLVPYFSQADQPSIRTQAFSDFFVPNGDGPYDNRVNAIRDVRYKLGRDSKGREFFGDLWTDPWESSNLLKGGLTSEQQTAYDDLRESLGILLGACTLARQGDPCNSDADCCSGRCRGQQDKKVCK